MHSFEVHSNESACRKSGRLGLEQALCTVHRGGSDSGDDLVGVVVVQDAIIETEE